MGNVIIEGIFMSAEVKEKTYEGNKTVNLFVDIYQPDSLSNEKTLTLKTDDTTLVNVLNQKYKLGTKISVSAIVSAYKNKAYYKLVKVLG